MRKFSGKYGKTKKNMSYTQKETDKITGIRAYKKHVESPVLA